MTAGVALVRMTIPLLDPLLDPVTVQLVYQNDGAVESDLVAHCPGLFNVVGAGATNSMAHYLAPSVDIGANHCSIEVYDITSHLDGSPHGSPVAAGNWTLTGTTENPSLVEGIAACVSYRANYGTDVEFGVGTRPRARDRNRHYFGPLTANTVTLPTDGTRVKFTSGFINDCLYNTKQVEVITGTGIAPDQWNLQVWSRKGAFVKPVAEYWMDDRPDYQRRRSDQPGNKTFIAA
jgi:hypothetical protein